MELLVACFVNQPTFEEDQPDLAKGGKSARA